MNTDNFVWTDELVNEFAYYYLKNEGRKLKLEISKIEQFKQSKKDKFDNKYTNFYTMDEVRQWAAADKELTKEKIEQSKKILTRYKSNNK